MAIQFQCHECGKTLRVQDELAGKRVKCPCGAVVTATAAAPPATAATARAARSAPARPAVPTSAARAGTARQAPALPAGGNPHFWGSNDLSSLFDELTEADLQTKRERDQQAAEAQAAAKDPLAAYRPNQGGSASSGSRSTGSRPLGLTILAVLNFIIALAALGFGVLFLVGTQAAGDALAEIEFLQEVATFVAVMILVGSVFYAAVGAGLLSGQPWGWWLGATVYSYNVFDRIYFAIFALIEGVPPAEALKKAGAILFAIGILSYLFNEDVRSYYKIKAKPAIAAAITIGSMAVFAFLLHLGLHLMVEAIPAE